MIFNKVKHKLCINLHYSGIDFYDAIYMYTNMDM